MRSQSISITNFPAPPLPDFITVQASLISYKSPTFATRPATGLNLFSSASLVILSRSLTFTHIKRHFPFDGPLAGPLPIPKVHCVKDALRNPRGLRHHPRRYTTSREIGNRDDDPTLGLHQWKMRHAGAYRIIEEVYAAFLHIFLGVVDDLVHGVFA